MPFQNTTVRRAVHLIFSILSLLIATTTAAQKDNGNQCDCFQTNGTTSAYYQNHRFFDYRNVPSELTSQPAVISQVADPKNKVASSPFFAAKSWTNDWETQTWNNRAVVNDSTSNAKTLMAYSQNNVYIEMSKDSSPNYKTYLTLRTTRTPTFQSAAEIDSVAINYHYISLRVLARVVGSPGACAGIFTWYCPDLCRAASSPDVEEADIEILTSDPLSAVHFTNQPSESPLGFTYKNATSNTTLPRPRIRSDWNEYRYDWLPGLSTWYVNQKELARISFHAPKGPAGLIFNMWSNGGSWSGDMKVGDSAYLQIQWIEIVFNTSEPVNSTVSKRDGMVIGDGVRLFDSAPSRELDDADERVQSLGARAEGAKSCKVVCNIDESTTVGTPASSKSIAGPGTDPSWLLLLFCCSVAFSYVY